MTKGDDLSSTQNEARITRLETNFKNLIHTVSSLADSVHADSQITRQSIEDLTKIVSDSRKLSWPLVFTVIGTGLTTITLVSGALFFWVNQSLQPVEADIEKVRMEAELGDKIVQLRLENAILKTHQSEKP